MFNRDASLTWSRVPANNHEVFRHKNSKDSCALSHVECLGDWTDCEGGGGGRGKIYNETQTRSLFFTSCFDKVASNCGGLADIRSSLSFDGSGSGDMIAVMLARLDCRIFCELYRSMRKLCTSSEGRFLKHLNFEICENSILHGIMETRHGTDLLRQ